MKHLRSLACIRGSSKKRPNLPSLKAKKAVIKSNEQVYECKSELVFNSCILPVEITLEREDDRNMVIAINRSEAKMQIGRSSRIIPLNLKPKERKWIEIMLGVDGAHSKITVLKSNDENSSFRNSLFGSLKQWQRSNPEENSKAIVSIDFQSREERVKLVTRDQETKNTQMKNFVSSLMARKFNRKTLISQQRDQSSVTHQPETEIRGYTDTLRNIIPNSRSIRQSFDYCRGTQQHRKPLARISRIHQARINLKDSITTGKSQKETSVGTKSILQFQKEDQSKNADHTSRWTMDLDEDQYSRRLKKFDTINKKIGGDHGKSFSPSQANDGLQNQLEIDKLETEHQSQEIVDEEINISSRLKPMGDESCFTNSQEKQTVKRHQESSSMYESYNVSSRQAIESSGSLYESRYE